VFANSFSLGYYLYEPGILRSDIRANSLGFSSPPIPQKKTKFRIITLGESSTSGYPVTYLHSYPRVLESILNSSLELDVEVINAGVLGHHSSGAVVVFNKKILPLNPDLIILQYAFNDAHNSETAVPTSSVTFSTNSFRLIIIANYLKQYSYFYRWLTNILQIKPDAKKTISNTKIIDKFEKNTEHLIKLALENNIDVIINVPHLNSEVLLPSKTFKVLFKLKEIIIRMGEKHNIPLVYSPLTLNTGNSSDKIFYFLTIFILTVQVI
tara:strand:- start:1870 stop:2670 length:801 start_codon:yes stop_codon:yes gene_type:complete